MPGPPLMLTAGITALGSGTLIGLGAIGAALLQDSVLRDAESSGAAKQFAMGASWPLVVTGAIAGVLVAGGGLLVPMSMMGAP